MSVIMGKTKILSINYKQSSLTYFYGHKLQSHLFARLFSDSKKQNLEQTLKYQILTAHYLCVHANIHLI